MAARQWRTRAEHGRAIRSRTGKPIRYRVGDGDKSDLPRTMFMKPKYKKYGDIISLKTPVEAQESVRKLRSEFDGAKTDAKKLRIARSTRLAANRADAMLKRKDLSIKEQREFHRIRKIYADTANEMFIDYGKGNPCPPVRRRRR